MWRMLKNFGRKDPLIFVLAIVVVVTVVGFGSLEMMHKTSTAEFCKTCHQEEVVGVRGEYYTWDKNIHSEVGVSCLDCHGEPGIGGYFQAHVVAGMNSLKAQILYSEDHIRDNLTAIASDPVKAEHAAPEESCLFCHSDDWNKKLRKSNVISVGPHFRNIDGVILPDYRNQYGRNDILSEDTKVGVTPNHKKHLDAGLTCTNCHLGVAHGGERYNLPKMETCFTCHDEKRAEFSTIPANDDCAACHTMNKKIQEGNFVKGIDETRWYMADLECSSCHADAWTKPNTDSCVKCHEDSSYGTMMIDTQTAFKSKLAEVQAVRDELYKERETFAPGKLALYNELNFMVRTMEKDGSMGVHNPEYFDAIYEAVKTKAEEIEKWVAPVVEEKAVEESHAVKEEKHEEKAEAFAGNSAELMEIVEGVAELNMAEKYVPKPSKPAVMFPHKFHAEKMSCQTCHENPEEGKLHVEVPAEIKGMNNVFHKELCLTCHKKEKKGPTTCNKCHAK